MNRNGKTLLVPRTVDDGRPSPHADKLFYLYDLPEEFWWRWPDPKADCTQNGYLDHPHAELSGMGPVIRPDDGLFLTCSFQNNRPVWVRGDA